MTTLEFALTAGLLIMLIIAVMDLGRYCLTLVSLQTLAGQAARSIVLKCAGPLSASCATVTLTTNDQQSLVSFLFVGSGSPTVAAAASQGTITVTASLSSFQALSPLWTGLSGPLSVSTKLYY